MVNARELKAAMVRKGYTQKDVAKSLGISTRTFSSKLSKGVFGSDEIEEMIVILDIKNPMPIFLTQ